MPRKISLLALLVLLVGCGKAVIATPHRSETIEASAMPTPASPTSEAGRPATPTCGSSPRCAASSSPTTWTFPRSASPRAAM